MKNRQKPVKEFLPVLCLDCSAVCMNSRLRIVCGETYGIRIYRSKNHDIKIYRIKIYRIRRKTPKTFPRI